MNGPSYKSFPDVKALLVEDNEVNQKVTQAMLQHFDIQSDIAENGEQAIARLKDSRYDLILMDCQMPVMNGYDATLEIRSGKHKLKTSSDVIIVAMTANTTEDDIDKCFAIGMNDFIAKPVELELIQAMLEKWYGSTR